jgi:hypothetical protein
MILSCIPWICFRSYPNSKPPKSNFVPKKIRISPNRRPLNIESESFAYKRWALHPSNSRADIDKVKHKRYRHRMQ